MLYCASYFFPTVKFGSSFGTYPMSLRRSVFIPVALCSDLLLVGSFKFTYACDHCCHLRCHSWRSGCFK